MRRKYFVLKILISSIFLFMANAAIAAEVGLPPKSSTIKIDTQSEALSADKNNDLDVEVSDIKLRAYSGAKSKYSSSLSFNYAGGSLEKPSSDRRPVVGSQILAPVSFSGNIGLRYRKNKNESYFLATGFFQSRPFHSRRSNEQLEVNTPHLGYNNTLAIDDWQIGSSVRAYITTLDYMREIGEVGTLGYSLSSVNSIANTRLSGGLSINTWVTAYDKNDESLREMQEDYGISFLPSLQYNKTGRVNVYTQFNLLSYSHHRSDRPEKFRKGIVTQTVGMGAAIVRDFYISPYVSFEPENMASDKTAVNISATINL